MTGFFAEWGWMVALVVGPVMLAAVMIWVMKAILGPDEPW